MSEAAKLTPPDDNEPDSLALAALLSSRVCHDLINPVGALRSGLEVLEDPSMEGAMRDAAMDLVRDGAQKAVALLSYARLAYGAAGGFGAQISLEDAQKALSDLFAVTKAELDWRIETGLAAKENVKVLMVLAYAAADCVPRGGVVTIEGDIQNFTITTTGKKVLLNDDLVRALGGDANDLTPKYTPALIASQLVASRGGAIRVERAEDVVTFKASFGS
ncbi:histidine phosphotransferase family protein [Hyphococcus luteus]|uniref:Histidine phosphotransferase n=1 Tax=Hyphococcus luteus TaxID=2058213 RepID=A0A2S7KAD3_9PROT|nr:histidine phosphotransferase family protein [Marinicaulis flavus]PQA89438.1 histidine phosphotransferase [Marinicaulis flavus]